MYRRFRKYNGKVISLTQNTSDILRWAEARSMVSNSDFLVVMNQKETERREITALLHIPPSLVGNITNSGKGAGIIFFENMLIPFAALFPRNTRLYELMTTDGEELAAILEKEKCAITISFTTKNRAKLQICSPLFQLSLQQYICSNANNAVLVRLIDVANLIVKGGDYNCNCTKKSL